MSRRISAWRSARSARTTRGARGSGHVLRRPRRRSARRRSPWPAAGSRRRWRRAASPPSSCRSRRRAGRRRSPSRVAGRAESAGPSKIVAVVAEVEEVGAVALAVVQPTRALPAIRLAGELAHRSGRRPARSGRRAPRPAAPASRPRRSGGDRSRPRRSRRRGPPTRTSGTGPDITNLSALYAYSCGVPTGLVGVPEC